MDWQAVETVALHRNGRVIPLEISFSDIEVDGQRLFVGFCRDITERKRVELALKESEAQFRQIVNDMPQLAWVARPDGQIEWFNSRWYEYTGATGAECEGERWIYYIHPRDREQTHTVWRHCINTGEHYSMEYRHMRHDGQWRWFLARALPVLDSDGHIVKWFGTSTNIHEQKEIEAALRQTNSELEEFAYVASHDLQEPLRKVAIYTQLLIEKFDGMADDEAQQFSEHIRSGVGRMQSLIQDLLLYSRTIHHTNEQDTKTADLNRSLAEALNVLERDINLSGARIHTAPLPIVPADQNQMSQVFQNLLSNALKYRCQDAPPEIHISAGKQDNDWIIEVRDNGIGFAPEYAEKIFGLFKRLYKEEYPGTGLGLAICRRIVERYQGSIWASSPGEGQGATFSICLPA